MSVTLTKPELEDLGERCWRSPSEFARVYLPEWFPSNMPWFHRGICALRTGQTDFLLDFGEEWWPEDIEQGAPSEWRVEDLVKIVTNFVEVVRDATFDSDGKIIEPELTAPLFEVETDDNDVIVAVRLTRPDSRLNAYLLPRGFSKTTLENMLNLRDVLYREADFTLYVSEAEGHAINQLLSIRGQLESNELILATFGDLKPTRDASEKWHDRLIETTTGQRVAALGSGGQLRGIVKDGKRPKRIVIDDFQDEESVDSPTQSEKDYNWFLRVLLPARKLFGKGESTIDFIGTMLGTNAVLAKVMNDDEWVRVRFGAYDRQGDPLWERAFPREKLEKIKGTYERAGKLDIWEYEYESRIPKRDTKSFPVDKIVYRTRETSDFVAKALVCDPAISDNPKADFFSLAAIGMTRHGAINVLNFHGEVGVEFHRQAELLFDFYFAHMTDLPPDQVKVGIEAVAYQRALVSAVQLQQHQRSEAWGQRAYFEVIPILHARHEGSKIARVNGILGPRTRAGLVEFSRPFGTLLSQMRDWPRGKKDGPDALAMAIRLLDPYLPAVADNDDATDDVVIQRAEDRAWGRIQQAWRKAP